MELGRNMTKEQERLKADIPALQKYAKHAADALCRNGYFHTQPHELRAFLQNLIPDDMDRTELMWNLLSEPVKSPRSLTYRAVLQTLIQNELADGYKVEMENYPCKDTSPQELIGDGDKADGGLAFAVRDTSVIK